MANRYEDLENRERQPEEATAWSTIQYQATPAGVVAETDDDTFETGVHVHCEFCCTVLVALVDPTHAAPRWYTVDDLLVGASIVDSVWARGAVERACAHLVADGLVTSSLRGKP